MFSKVKRPTQVMHAPSIVSVREKPTARSLLLLITLVWNLGSFGQFSTVSEKTLIAADVGRATVYILPTGNEVFDQALYDAVHELWTLTPIGDLGDIFDKVDLRIAGRLYIGYLDGGLRRSVALIRGGTDKSIYDLGKQDILAYCPMGSARNENTIEQCAYRIPLMVTGLQQIMNMRLQNEGASVGARDLNRLGSQRKISKFLVETALFYDAEIQDLKDVMGHKIEFVDRAELEEAIKDQWPGVALLVPVFGFTLDVIIYDLGIRECIYLNHTMQTWEYTRLARGHVDPLVGTFDLR